MSDSVNTNLGLGGFNPINNPTVLSGGAASGGGSETLGVGTAGDKIFFDTPQTRGSNSLTPGQTASGVTVQSGDGNTMLTYSAASPTTSSNSGGAGTYTNEWTYSNDGGKDSVTSYSTMPGVYTIQSGNDTFRTDAQQNVSKLDGDHWQQVGNLSDMGSWQNQSGIDSDAAKLLQGVETNPNGQTYNDPNSVLDMAKAGMPFNKFNPTDIDTMTNLRKEVAGQETHGAADPVAGALNNMGYNTQGQQSSASGADSGNQPYQFSMFGNGQSNPQISPQEALDVLTAILNFGGFGDNTSAPQALGGWQTG